MAGAMKHVVSADVYARGVASCSRPQVVGLRSIVCLAKRREIERDYDFGELMGPIRERVFAGRGLPVKEFTAAIECIKNADQAMRALEVIQKFLANRSALGEGASSSGSDLGLEAATQPPPSMPSSSSSAVSSSLDMSRWLSDWHLRKRFLSRISHIAILELNRPDIVYNIVGAMNAYKISTYFAKDLIKELGQYSNVPVDVLLRIAQLNLDQRGAADKGTRGAYFALMDIMKARGMGGEALAPVKQALAAGRPRGSSPANSSSFVAAPAVPVPQPVGSLA